MLPNRVFDRTPHILTAGKASDNSGESVATCLKEYSIDDAKMALEFVANIDPNVYKPKYKTEPYENKMRKGVYTDIKKILQPPVKTRYETLINELKETSYESHWNKVVGKGRDPVPGLPKGLNPVETTFGTKRKKCDTVKDLVNPPKGIYQILSESQIGHELYRKTHNDYNLGERICRNYLSPAYDSTKRFGHRTKYDPRGIWVRCACTWHNNEPAIFTNRIQADYLNKTKNRLGEHLTLNNIAQQLQSDFVYGRPYKRELYGVEELMKDANCSPCLFKRDLKTWLSSFNKLKLAMKKRYRPEFNIDDLYQRLLYYDNEKCGCLPLDIFYKVCACYYFKFDRENLEPLLKLLQIICDEKINYKKFLEILDYHAEPIQLMKINDIPLRNQYLISTTQAATCDYLIINNADSKPAGIPSIRYDLGRPIVHSGGCRADLENLSDECSAAILLNPSVYLNYGLSFRDFYIPREKSVIRNLFEKVGHKFDDATFEKLWKTAIDQDNTGLVCVDTFNKLVQAQERKPENLIIDEATC